MGLCCYCCGRLDYNKSHIEHYYPRNLCKIKNRKEQIDYNNVSEKTVERQSKKMTNIKYVERGLKKPDVIEIGMFVKYIFYRQSGDKTYANKDAKQDAKQDANKDAKSKILTYEAKIIEYLEINKEINISTSMKLLNLSKSRTNAILNNMCKNGIIKKHGVNRATKYIFKEKDE